MEPEGSIPCAQRSATWSYLEPVESSPQPWNFVVWNVTFPVKFTTKKINSASYKQTNSKCLCITLQMITSARSEVSTTVWIQMLCVATPCIILTVCHHFNPDDGRSIFPWNVSTYSQNTTRRNNPDHIFNLQLLFASFIFSVLQKRGLV
jgi:hypothetical protein